MSPAIASAVSAGHFRDLKRCHAIALEAFGGKTDGHSLAGCRVDARALVVIHPRWVGSRDRNGLLDREARLAAQLHQHVALVIQA